jgi:hypothetical protein
MPDADPLTLFRERLRRGPDPALAADLDAAVRAHRAQPQPTRTEPCPLEPHRYGGITSGIRCRRCRR